MTLGYIRSAPSGRDSWQLESRDEALGTVNATTVTELPITFSGYPFPLIVPAQSLPAGLVPSATRVSSSSVAQFGLGNSTAGNVAAGTVSLRVLSLPVNDFLRDSPSGPMTTNEWAASSKRFSVNFPLINGFTNGFVDVDFPGLRLGDVVLASYAGGVAWTAATFLSHAFCTSSDVCRLVANNIGAANRDPADGLIIDCIALKPLVQSSPPKNSPAGDVVLQLGTVTIDHTSIAARTFLQSNSTAAPSFPVRTVKFERAILVASPTSALPAGIFYAGCRVIAADGRVGVTLGNATAGAIVPGTITWTIAAFTAGVSP